MIPAAAVVDDAILVLNGIAVALLALLVRTVWRLSERIARLEGRFNGRISERDRE